SQGQRRAGRRVTLAGVVGLFDERIVSVAATEQPCRARHEAVKEVHTDREISAVDERTPTRVYDLADLGLFALPSRSTLHERHSRRPGRLDVREHAAGGGE